MKKLPSVFTFDLLVANSGSHHTKPDMIWRPCDLLRAQSFSRRWRTNFVVKAGDFLINIQLSVVALMNEGATERDMGHSGSQPVSLFVKSIISATTQPLDIVSGLLMRIRTGRTSKSASTLPITRVLLLWKTGALLKTIETCCQKEQKKKKVVLPTVKLSHS